MQPELRLASAEARVLVEPLRRDVDGLRGHARATQSGAGECRECAGDERASQPTPALVGRDGDQLDRPDPGALVEVADDDAGGAGVRDRQAARRVVEPAPYEGRVQLA